MSTSILLLGVLFSSVGFGYFLYARKQRENPCRLRVESS